MAKVVITLCVLIGLTLGFPETSGPYPAKGWKPQGARLELPRNNYGPPREEANEPEADDIEVTTLTNEYLPPTTIEPENDEDALRVQGLPAVDAVSQFRNYQRQIPSNVVARQPNARIQVAPAPAFAGQPLLLSSLFAPQFAPVSGQLQERKFGQIQQQQQQVSEFGLQFAPVSGQLQERKFGQIQQQQQQVSGFAPQFGQIQQQQQQQQQVSEFGPQFAPVSGQLQEKKFVQNQQQQVQEFNNPKNDAQQLPAQAYGPPKTNSNLPEVPQNEEPQQPQSESDDYVDDQDATDEPTIAISYAESDVSPVEVTKQGQAGQYYILLPDNSLQKVRFATKQTDEDRQINGFSAQLRYSPVESIKDPVYGYDEQGKLVRLFK